jgi:hypothetical protein
LLFQNLTTFLFSLNHSNSTLSTQYQIFTLFDILKHQEIVQHLKKISYLIIFFFFFLSNMLPLKRKITTIDLENQNDDKNENFDEFLEMKQFSNGHKTNNNDMQTSFSNNNVKNRRLSLQGIARVPYKRVKSNPLNTDPNNTSLLSWALSKMLPVDLTKEEHDETLSQLPLELLFEHILIHLSFLDLIRLALTSKFWQKLLINSEYEGNCFFVCNILIWYIRIFIYFAFLFDLFYSLFCRCHFL